MCGSKNINEESREDVVDNINSMDNGVTNIQEPSPEISSTISQNLQNDNENDENELQSSNTTNSIDIQAAIELAVENNNNHNNHTSNIINASTSSTSPSSRFFNSLPSFQLTSFFNRFLNSQNHQNNNNNHISLNILTKSSDSKSQNNFKEEYFDEIFEDEPNYPFEYNFMYSCVYCRANLAIHSELISRSFQGSQGRAYLFNTVINVNQKQADKRL